MEPSQSLPVAATVPHAGRGRRFWLLTAAALVGVALTAGAGFWQLDRAAQKQAVQAAVQARASEPPLDARALRGWSARIDGGEAAAMDQALQRPVALQGRWLAEHTVALENRPMDGRAGFYIVTPLALSDADGPLGVVLVQRGWLPRQTHDRTALAPFDTPSGPVSVRGRTAAGPSRTFQLGASAGEGRIRQNLDRAAFARETGLPLLALSVLQTDADAGGLQRHWAAPDAGVEKHHGYAFQWFGMAALLALAYVWFQLVRPLVRS